jgi:hypothetical protein
VQREGRSGGIKYPLLASGAKMEATCPATELAVALTWPTASKLAHAAIGNVSLAVDLRLGVNFLGGRVWGDKTAKGGDD